MDSSAVAGAPRTDVRTSTLAAACLVFLQFGLLIGTWAAHVPVLQARLAVDTGTLGLALLGSGIGTIVSQMFAALLVVRIGSRAASVGFGVLSALAAVLAIYAQSVPWLFFSCILVGLSWGGLNVSMNTQGNEIELARGRPTLSLLHGFVSLGMLSSSAAAALLIGAGWANGEAALLIGAVCVAASLVAMPYLLRIPAAPGGAGGLTRPHPAVLGFGVVAFLIFIVEGGMVDWSALFLVLEKGADPAIAPLGFVAFSASMAVTRLLGEPLILAFGRRNLVILGALLVAAAIATATLSPWLWLSLAAYAVAGAATANIIPTLIASAAQTPGVRPSVAIGTVGTMMTLGLLVGPPFIGLVSRQTGLTAGMLLLTASAAAVALLAAAQRWAPARSG